MQQGKGEGGDVGIRLVVSEFVNGSAGKKGMDVWRTALGSDQ